MAEKLLTGRAGLPAQGPGVRGHLRHLRLGAGVFTLLRQGPAAGDGGHARDGPPEPDHGGPAAHRRARAAVGAVPRPRHGRGGDRQPRARQAQRDADPRGMAGVLPRGRPPHLSEICRLAGNPDERDAPDPPQPADGELRRDGPARRLPSPRSPPRAPARRARRRAGGRGRERPRSIVAGRVQPDAGRAASRRTTPRRSSPQGGRTT